MTEITIKISLTPRELQGLSLYMLEANKHKMETLAPPKLKDGEALMTISRAAEYAMRTIFQLYKAEDDIEDYKDNIEEIYADSRCA